MDINLLYNELEELNLPKDHYVIFASGPMSAIGLKEANDFDLIITEKLREKLSNIYPINEKGMLYTGNIEMSSNWPHVDNEIEIIQNPEIINGFPFAKLKYVLDWKQKMGREKDFKDIEIIQKYLSGKQNLN